MARPGYIPAALRPKTGPDAPVSWIEGKLFVRGYNGKHRNKVRNVWADGDRTGAEKLASEFGLEIVEIEDAEKPESWSPDKRRAKPEPAPAPEPDPAYDRDNFAEPAVPFVRAEAAQLMNRAAEVLESETLAEPAPKPETVTAAEAGSSLFLHVDVSKYRMPDGEAETATLEAVGRLVREMEPGAEMHGPEATAAWAALRAMFTQPQPAPEPPPAPEIGANDPPGTQKAMVVRPLPGNKWLVRTLKKADERVLYLKGKQFVKQNWRISVRANDYDGQGGVVLVGDYNRYGDRLA